MDLWANIKRLREARGKSQMRVYLDGGADAGGIEPGALSKIEGGKNPNPELQTLQRVARGIGVPVAELFIDAEGLPVTVPPEEEAPRKKAASAPG